MAFRAGERGALEWVYAQHVEALIAFLRGGFAFDARGRSLRFTGFVSTFELHDAVQESFRRAFEPKARQSYDGLRPFAPWLLMIARNVVLKEYRRKDRLFVDAELADAKLETQGQPTGEGMEHALERKRVRALVAEFVASLEPADQALLRARFVDGEAQRVVAERLGIGRQRLRTRESKLRERLVQFLVQRGHDDPRQPDTQVGALSLLVVLPAQSWIDPLGDLMFFDQPLLVARSCTHA